MVFCNEYGAFTNYNWWKVTILILIDGFLQYWQNEMINMAVNSHNPYFNRWFSAIKTIHGPLNHLLCHNPYFNRWFSAIYIIKCFKFWMKLSQSLF